MCQPGKLRHILRQTLRANNTHNAETAHFWRAHSQPRCLMLLSHPLLLEQSPRFPCLSHIHLCRCHQACIEGIIELLAVQVFADKHQLAVLLLP